MRWMNERKRRKEKEKRLNTLSSEEHEKLQEEEKNAYFNVVSNLVQRRGRLNAIKDFPVEGIDGSLITLEEHDKDLEGEQEND